MKLRKATTNDWEILLEWRNDIETRKNSHNMELIKEDNHKKWINSVLENDQTQLYIALENETPAGTVRVNFDKNSKSYELSWTISSDFRGKGIGKKMVKLLADTLNDKLRAEIKTENIASIKIAEFAGLKFKKEENGISHFSNY